MTIRETIDILEKIGEKANHNMHGAPAIEFSLSFPNDSKLTS